MLSKIVRFFLLFRLTAAYLAVSSERIMLLSHVRARIIRQVIEAFRNAFPYSFLNPKLVLERKRHVFSNIYIFRTSVRYHRSDENTKIKKDRLPQDVHSFD